MHHVYVIENENQGWYIGYSTNVRRRLAEHNAHKNKSTAKAKEWKLIYCESYIEKMDALGREKFLKSGSGWKFLKKQMRYYLEKRSI
jgi:putative endonuclease